MIFISSRKVCLFLVFWFFVIFSSSPLLSQESQTSKPVSPPSEEDYNYYQKHGRKSSLWNEKVQKGFEAYEKGDCEKAISFFKQAMSEGCKDPLLIFKLAACAELMGSYYSAAQYYKQAEEGLSTLSAPHRYAQDFYEAYGRVLYLNQKTEAALPYLLQAEKGGTPSYLLFYLLGQIYLTKGQNQMAMEYFNKAIQQPLNQVPPVQLAKIYRALGKSYLELKEADKAIQFLELAVKNNPADAESKQLLYQAKEFKRQQTIFKMMEGISNPGTSKP